MDCQELVDSLSDFIDNALDPSHRAEAHRHLAACRNCAQVVETMHRIIALCRESQHCRCLGADRRARLLEVLERALATRMG